MAHSLCLCTHVRLGKGRGSFYITSPCLGETRWNWIGQDFGLLVNYVNLMMPHAIRPPEFPVLLLSAWSPNPRSSGFSWTTTERKSTPRWDIVDNDITLSTRYISATVSDTGWSISRASMLPRSPTWRSSASRSPCFFCVQSFRYIDRSARYLNLELTLSGLKCGPAALQSSVKLPNWWICKPCRPGVSPKIVPRTITGPPSVACWNFNSPRILGNLATPIILTTAATGRIFTIEK